MELSGTLDLSLCPSHVPFPPSSTSSLIVFGKGGKGQYGLGDRHTQRGSRRVPFRGRENKEY